MSGSTYTDVTDHSRLGNANLLVRTPVRHTVPQMAIDAWVQHPASQAKLKAAQDLAAKDFREWRQNLRSIVDTMYRKVDT